MLQTNLIEGFKKAGIPRSYRAGEPLVLQDEPSTGMYLILQGEVKVLMRQPDGTSRQVASMSAGQTMGEISLLLEQPHAATVIAVTDTETRLITPTRLQDLRHEDPDLALHLFETLAFTLAGHLLDQNRQIAALRRENEELEKKLERQTGEFSYFNR